MSWRHWRLPMRSSSLSSLMKRAFSIKRQIGRRTATLQRQYSGMAGQIENCQVGVFLAYASLRGHSLLDREVYLPRSCIVDPMRCREAHVPEAHVPEELAFTTKPELARWMLHWLLQAGLPVAWVTGDTVYGSAPFLRADLEARLEAYVLAVPCKE